MKQYITREQLLNELDDDAKERLREWWKPQFADVYVARLDEMGPDYTFFPITCKGHGEDYANVSKDESLPLLSIGQMIEFIEHNKGIKTITKNNVWLDSKKSKEDWWTIQYYDSKSTMGFRNVTSERLLHVLWEAVKYILNDTSN